MSTVSGFRLSPQQVQAHRQATPPVELHWHIEHSRPGALDGQRLAARLQQLAGDEELLRTRLATLPGLSEPVQLIGQQALIAIYLQGQALHVAEDPVLSLHLDTQADGLQLRLRAAATHFDLSSLRLLAAWLLFGEDEQQRLQYADYAEWKWQTAEAAEAAEARAFWQQAQARAAACRLLLDRAASGSSPCSRTLALDKRAIDAAASRCGIAPRVLLLAAWAALLARLSGQSEVTLACVDAGRGEGLDDALGLFEQALPLTLSVDLARPLSAQTAAIETVLTRMDNWRDYFIEPNACAYAFDYQQPDLPAAVQESHAAGHAEHFALKLTVVDHADQLSARLHVDSARFGAEAVDCLVEQWTLGLQGLLHSPERALGALPLTGPLQQALLMRNGGSDAASATEPILLVERFRQLLHSHGQATAVSDAEGRWTYAQLDAASDRLAAHLQARGVGAGAVVAIVLPRRRQALAAILAVLKAGAAYLPVDPNYPSVRRAYMLTDSGARHLLHDATIEAGHTVDFRYDVDALLAEQPAAPCKPVAIGPDSPAYLIYTSGSTGQPKAVAISHGALAVSTHARTSYYQEPVQAYLLLSSFAFDSSVAGIFWTLSQGGHLVLPAPGDELAPARLGQLIEAEQISHGLCVPSLYQALLDEIPPRQLYSLRTWIVAGEACPEALPRQHAATLPQAGLFNEYGPTEATVWATVDPLHEGGRVSIGRPIAPMVLDLVNEQGEPAGVGEIGEIVLSGPCLAIGYWNRPEATAAAFAPLPSAGRSRAYRTGDLAWRDVDGRLFFVGRRDHQIKIRGHRIELGEVERCLRLHPDVREAAVVVQERSTGKRLLGYILARHGYAPASEAMLDFLRQHLPEPMLPAMVLTLDAFPRTPNGKLDSQALPDPDSLLHKALVAPRTPTETLLATIVADVLKLPAVSVEDSFLQIGGDSILTLQVVARARERGLSISARQIFELQTVARLAEVVSSAPAASGNSASVACLAAFQLDADELAALNDELADLEPNA